MDNVTQKKATKFVEIKFERMYPPCRILSAGDFSEREIRMLERQYGCCIQRPSN